MESSRDEGEDRRVGYDIDTTFGAHIASDVCRWRLRERMVRVILLAISTVSPARIVTWINLAARFR